MESILNGEIINTIALCRRFYSPRLCADVEHGIVFDTALHGEVCSFIIIRRATSNKIKRFVVFNDKIDLLIFCHSDPSGCLSCVCMGSAASLLFDGIDLCGYRVFNPEILSRGRAGVLNPYHNTVRLPAPVKERVQGPAEIHNLWASNSQVSAILIYACQSSFSDSPISIPCSNRGGSNTGKCCQHRKDWRIMVESVYQAQEIIVHVVLFLLGVLAYLFQLFAMIALHGWWCDRRIRYNEAPGSRDKLVSDIRLAFEIALIIALQAAVGFLALIAITVLLQDF